MIENEIYCYINDFLKQNISKKTSCIVGNKKSSWKICILAILVKLVVILRLGLGNISKRITSLIFLNIYTPPEHALTSIIIFPLKKIDKPNSKFDLKIKEALHIIWRQTLNKIIYLSHPFAIASIPVVLFFVCFFVLFLRFSFIYYFYYLWH